MLVSLIGRPASVILRVTAGPADCFHHAFPWCVEDRASKRAFPETNGRCWVMRISTTLNRVLLAGFACVAAFVSPQANAANLLLNGGFEGGVQSVTLNGFTNSNVPNDWVPNAAFVQFSASNGVVSNPVHSGIASLSIGSPDNQLRSRS
jgi:hypothetical protein